MFTKPSLDTVVALVGLLIFLVGVYLLLGLPIALILLGLVLIYIGWKLPEKRTQ